jgi:hypothetical protein
MNKLMRVVVVTVGVVTLAVVPFASASAAPSGDPNRTRTASPAHACAAVVGTLAQFNISPAGFDYSECVRELGGRVPDTAWGGDPYQRCAELEAGVFVPPLGRTFTLTYPYTFHAEAGDPFPNLRAHNREQCARALWTFHEIESHLPAQG